MRFSAIIAAALVGASTTIAVPAMKRNDLLCPGLEATPQCCAVNALGVADLDCSTPSVLPANKTAFVALCASMGQQAQCCTLPVLGQALLCMSPP